MSNPFDIPDMAPKAKVLYSPRWHAYDEHRCVLPEVASGGYSRYISWEDEGTVAQCACGKKWVMKDGWSVDGSTRCLRWRPLHWYHFKSRRNYKSYSEKK